MARTYRNIQHAHINARRINHANYRRNELAAIEQITDELGSNFVSNRLRSALSRIPTNWDDHNVSAYDEIYDTHNTAMLRLLRLVHNDDSFTQVGQQISNGRITYRYDGSTLVMPNGTTVYSVGDRLFRLLQVRFYCNNLERTWQQAGCQRIIGQLV